MLKIYALIIRILEALTITKSTKRSKFCYVVTGDRFCFEWKASFLLWPVIIIGHAQVSLPGLTFAVFLLDPIASPDFGRKADGQATH